MFKKDQSADIINSQVEIIEELMENGQIKRYIKGRTLGKGGFAECVEFISQQTGIRYAAKIIEKITLEKGKAKEKLQSQIFIHKLLRHQNIVKFQHFFEDHQYVYILLEVCSNNTLNQLLKRRKALTEIEVKYYMLQIIQAVKYIHSKRVIHRDLKLGNFFLSDSLQVKVGDFGLATRLNNGERKNTVCGTPNYLAPQILQSKKGHSYEVDIWSLGVIAYALLFGRPPFETNQVKTTYQKIKICDFTFPFNNKASDEAKAFISKMLKLNPDQRATVDQLLKDQFLTNQDIPKTLPLSTLACPPSKNFLEQVKTEARLASQMIKKQKIDELQIHMNSSRTSKQSHNYKCLMATDKVQSFHLQNNLKKNERSLGSMTRTVSTAAIPTRKKINSNLQQSNIRVWVSHFQDHQKYGLFYRLNTNHVGMRFNDTTCLISNLKINKFKYIIIQNSKEHQVEIFQSGQEKEILQKKMKIMNHFAKDIKNKEMECIQPKNPLMKIRDDGCPSSVYVMAYYNTSHYTMFLLSNGAFHAKFKDESDLLLENEQIIYFNKEKKKSIIKLARINDINEEIKIKYNHVSALIKKIKKLKMIAPEQKRQKQNPYPQHSIQSKLSKSKDTSKRQFCSSTNLQFSKRPLGQYTSNK